MLSSGRIYIARGPWCGKDFRYIFLPNASEDKKSLTIWARDPGTVPYGKYGTGYCITFIKAWMMPEVATFRTKTLDFILVIRLNRLEKIQLRECARPPARQHYLSLSTGCTRVLLYAKILKKLKMKKHEFLSNFCHWWNFDWGGPGPLGHPSGYAYDFEIRSRPYSKFFHKKKHLKQN